MKLSNFRLLKITGNNALNWKFKASVDVTTGFIFKKTITREIYRTYASYWYFSDTGEFTPGNEVEKLVRAFEAEIGTSIERAKVQ
jgi:hypothetical protein